MKNLEIIKFEDKIFGVFKESDCLNLPNTGQYRHILTLDPREAGECLSIIYALHPLFEFYTYSN